jgi:hypothetical protein
MTVTVLIRHIYQWRFLIIIIMTINCRGSQNRELLHQQMEMPAHGVRWSVTDSNSCGCEMKSGTRLGEKSKGK